MKKPDDIHLDAEALAGIEARLQAKRLDEGDFELLLKLLKLGRGAPASAGDRTLQHAQNSETDIWP